MDVGVRTALHRFLSSESGSAHVCDYACTLSQVQVIIAISKYLGIAVTGDHQQKAFQLGKTVAKHFEMGITDTLAETFSTVLKDVILDKKTSFPHVAWN